MTEALMDQKMLQGKHILFTKPISGFLSVFTNKTNAQRHTQRMENFVEVSA